MISTCLLGTTLTLSAEFRNENDVLFTPDNVNIKYKKPNVTLPVTINLTPTSPNKYTVAVLMDAAGSWKFRWESTTGNTVAKEFSITVTDTIVK